MRIGVVAFQGDFARHLEHLGKLDVEPIEVRTVADLSTCAGLVVPGGESTTIGKLLERFGLMEALRRSVTDGFPVFGTCAGAILLADTIEASDQPRIGGIPMTVRRNAYGRQIASFESEVAIRDARFAAYSAIGQGENGMHGVFIRAPRIITIDHSVSEILAYEDDPVCVQKDNLLAATFHPELTPDVRLHRFFLQEVVARA